MPKVILAVNKLDRKKHVPYSIIFKVNLELGATRVFWALVNERTSVRWKLFSEASVNFSSHNFERTPSVVWNNPKITCNEWLGKFRKYRVFRFLLALRSSNILKKLSESQT